MSTTDELSSNPDDRGISPVQGSGGGGLSMQSTGGKALALSALVLGCGLFLYLGKDGETSNEKPARLETIRQTERYQAPTFPQEPEAPAAHPIAAPPSAEPEQQRPEPLERERPQKPSEAEERLRASQYAPLMAIKGNQRDSGGGDAGVNAGRVSPANQQAQREPTALETNLRASQIDMNKAAYLPNRDLLITAGSILPCVLQTAMDTTNPGLVSCVIPRDVPSESGRVVLMEKGTRVLGEYQGGMRQGQERIFVAWNRAVTPTGVAVTLDSPASDALGRSGFDGEIETYFWTRFGGALLLSIVSDGAKVGSTYLSDRDIEIRETQNAGGDAAAIALENSINIAPVLRKNQGEEVSIFVANDLNFSDVYQLRRTSGLGIGDADAVSHSTLRGDVSSSTVSRPVFKP